MRTNKGAASAAVFRFFGRINDIVLHPVSTIYLVCVAEQDGIVLPGHKH